ncbi:sugar porter family MFS transporter [Simiduia agarivorans]|uniref:D-xylose-proton symporter n=1 Tax=Simiduia agarivorans (strain DSM 21679 / JCM 13881 / BCRC 17597 / SA1) TaxID=1117647 RepID=K4KKF6_SIMAS|nr:sugar porter family MFS transporter [Simiduia agarivorans]AFU98523.2 sugar transporter [Simiduia agarivorans SA1 = DSM 21679]
MTELHMNAAVMAADQSEPLGWPLLKSAIVAALAGFLFGYDTGVISGSQLYFTEYFSLSAAEQGWAVGSALYGCLLGALVAGLLTSRYGRRPALIFSAILFVISAVGSGAAESLTSLSIYRLIGGIGVGLASMAAPMYIAEIAPAAVRGKLVSLYQFAIVLGFFVVFLASYGIGGGNVAALSAEAQADAHAYNLSHGWRWMLWSETPVAVAFLLLLLLVPESPRWLVLKGQSSRALGVIRNLGYPQPEQQLNAIEQDVGASSAGHWRQLLAKPLRNLLLVGILLSVFQQVTGINAILYYGAEIFSQALGYGPADALKQQLWLGGVNFAATIVAIVTVDRWGRKPLLLLGLTGMMLGLLIFSTMLLTGKLGMTALISILLFIGAFAISMGPVVWVLLSEMFPNQYRAQALSIAVAAQWLFNAIVAGLFPVVNQLAINQSLFNGALPYLIFAAFCLLALVFVVLAVRETKGQSLEDLSKVWTKQDN